MLKKLLIAAAVIAMSSTAFAECGPYVGASIGVNDILSQFKTNEAGTDPFGNSFTSSTTTRHGTRGALLNAFAGYGATVGCNMWLGGEVFASYASNNSNIISDSDANSTDPTDILVVSQSSSLTAKLRQKWSYGVSVLPGLMVLDHTLVYARLGVVQTRFENSLNASATTSVFVPPNPVAVATATRTYSNTQNKNIWGYQVGVGFQTAIAPCVDLRGEYVYTGYRSYNLDRGAKVTPSTDQFNVGLVYKFG